MSEQKWEQVDLTLATTTGDEKVPALVHPNAPGLAVTMHLFGVFDVTHVGSGQKIAGPYERCGHAELVLAELAQCLDWTQGAAAIAAQLEQRRDEPVPFAGCTVTSGGVTRRQTIADLFGARGRGSLATTFRGKGPKMIQRSVQSRC